MPQFVNCALWWQDESTLIRLALLPHRKVLCSNPPSGRGLHAVSLHVLPMSMWILSGRFGFPPQSKDSVCVGPVTNWWPAQGLPKLVDLTSYTPNVLQCGEKLEMVLEKLLCLLQLITTRKDFHMLTGCAAYHSFLWCFSLYQLLLS